MFRRRMLALLLAASLLAACGSPNVTISDPVVDSIATAIARDRRGAHTLEN